MDFIASVNSCSLSTEITPTFSQTKPPAKLAISAVFLGSRPLIRQSVATLITVSPAPETSAMFL